MQGRCSEDGATSDVQTDTQRTIVEVTAAGALSVSTECPWGLLLSDKRHVPFPSDKQRITIGRSHECDVVLDDPRISAVHLALTLSVEVCVPSPGGLPRRCSDDDDGDDDDDGGNGGVRFCRRHSRPRNSRAPMESRGGGTSCFSDRDGNENTRFPELLRHGASNVKVYLEDLSSNGTYVNDTMVGKGRRCQLYSGDDIGVVSLPAKISRDEEVEEERREMPVNASSTVAVGQEKILGALPQIRSYVEIFSFHAYHSAVPNSLVPNAPTASFLPEQIGQQQRVPGPVMEKDHVSALRQFLPSPFRSHRFQRGRPIGYGSSSVVYAGIDLDTGRMVALKVLAHDNSVSLSSSASKRGCCNSSCPFEERPAELRSNCQEHLYGLDESLRELHFLVRLVHHRIVQCLGVQKVPEGLCIILEYVAGGTLKDLIKNFGAFHEHVIRLYTLQVLQGMEYLQTRGVVHGDLKSANVLMSERGDVKISDFGTSRFAQTICAADSKSQENCDGDGGDEKKLSGTPIYMSPELIWKQETTFSSDVWALGCMVYEMAVGAPPWEELHGLPPLSIVWHIGNATDGPSLNRVRERGGSPALLNFLESALQMDHNLRPSVAELLKHPFISGHTRITWTPPLAVFPSTPPCWSQHVSSSALQSQMPPASLGASNHGDVAPCGDVSDTCGDAMLLGNDGGELQLINSQRSLPALSDPFSAQNQGLPSSSSSSSMTLVGGINDHKAFVYELCRKKLFSEDDPTVSGGEMQRVCSVVIAHPRQRCRLDAAARFFQGSNCGKNNNNNNNNNGCKTRVSHTQCGECGAESTAIPSHLITTECSGLLQPFKE